MLSGRIAVLSALCCLVAVTAWADGTNLVIDGVTYSNVTFKTITPATVTIYHSTGVATIPLGKLSPDLQRRFGYDEQKAEVYRQKAAVQEAAQAERDRQKAVATSLIRER